MPEKNTFKIKLTREQELQLAAITGELTGFLEIGEDEIEEEEPCAQPVTMTDTTGAWSFSGPATAGSVNRVTPQTPLTDVIELFYRDGYVLMENALPAQQLAEIVAAYDRVLAEHVVQHPPKPDEYRVRVLRLLERDPVFEQLMDLPSTFAVARAIIGADIELGSSGQILHKLPHTPAWTGWHNEGIDLVNVPYPRQVYYVQCTYFMSDVTDEMGPITVLPGTHRAPCPPPWEEYNREDGQPRDIEGMLGITGPAGSCLIQHSEIWHTNMPNRCDQARPTIQTTYNHAWMKQWQDGQDTTPEFAARQTDPIRRQLCGCFVWHRNKTHFPAHLYPAPPAPSGEVPTNDP